LVVELNDELGSPPRDTDYRPWGPRAEDPMGGWGREWSELEEAALLAPEGVHRHVLEGEPLPLQPPAGGGCGPPMGVRW